MARRYTDLQLNDHQAVEVRQSLYRGIALSSLLHAGFRLTWLLARTNGLIKRKPA
ncbi:MAG TPA: hypothetical protein VNM22_20075 [Candidatus Limnocylindrales bacterium]|nr:hypothetical protein [Candidatus Limnocylindrales bacterium]